VELLHVAEFRRLDREHRHAEALRRGAHILQDASPGGGGSWENVEAAQQESRPVAQALRRYRTTRLAQSMRPTARGVGR
jgi:hypothetical protein